MKYKVKAIKEIRYIDTFYVDAESKDEAKIVVYDNADSPDESIDYDCTYFEVISVEINE